MQPIQEILKEFDENFDLFNPRKGGFIPRYLTSSDYDAIKQFFTTKLQADREAVKKMVEEEKKDDSFAVQIDDRYLMEYKAGFNDALKIIITKLNNLQ